MMTKKALILFGFLTLTIGPKAKALEVDMNFDVDTNMPGVSFKVNLKETTKLSYVPGKDKELKIPTKNLTTGMDMRDEHMQEMVFKSGGDLVFKIAEDNCAKGAPCSVQGEFIVEGKSKKATLNFVKSGDFLEAPIEFLLKEDFAIEASRMGVSVENKLPGKIRIKI